MHVPQVPQNNKKTKKTIFGPKQDNTKQPNIQQTNTQQSKPLQPVDLNLDVKLSDYEKKIEDALLRDDNNLIFSIDPKDNAIFHKAAQNYVYAQKTERINIRVKVGDLMQIKAKATKNNIPYQTLLKMLIHKYATGQLEIAL